MNTDIRIAIDFWQHHKTKKLIRRVGIEGARSLQILWSWAAGNRSNGVLLGMDEDDIEFVSDWNGEAGAFVKALVDLHWIDTEEGCYILHEWQEHNPWAADAEARSDKARLSRLRQVNPAAYEMCIQDGKTAINQREYDDLKNYSGERQRNASETPADSQRTPASSPAPSPSPSPVKLINTPYPSYEGKDDGDILKSRENGTNPRALGTNPRAVQENPRAKGNNPKEYTLEFESFWRTYPKKVGKEAAWKAWKNKKKEGKLPSLAELLGAIDTFRQTEQWTRDGGQYIPNPSTWINQCRWLDELTESAPSRGYTGLKNIWDD